jgi:GNAT superfamily N-acetyltransferase
MNSALDHYTELRAKRSVDALGIFAYYMGEAIGWSLFTYESDDYYFQSEDGKACAQVYVRPVYRRLGIGRKLISQAAKLADPDIVKVYAHSDYSFFDVVMKEQRNLHAI